MTAARTITLAAAPPLAPLLAGAAALAPFKRPAAGAALPGTRLVLAGARTDPARLAAYAEVCGLPRGGPGAPLPLLYPHVLGFPLALRIMAERAFPLPLPGLVHTRVELARTGPALRADDRPDLHVHAESLVPHRRGTEVVVVTEARIGGEPVWVSRSRYLARHRTAAPDAPPGSAGTPDTAPGERDRGRDRDAPEPPGLARWELPGDLGRRYAAASGDRNPVHLHALTARPFGFRRAVAHGMWSLARCLAEAERAEGPAAGAQAAFRAPVLLPGAVDYAAAPTADGTAFRLSGGGRTRVEGSTRRAAAERPGGA
ncbi:MaoC/PaaZ C-terminal domain-containing protein [Streptomyces sp. C10-9-1]|uniref:MaoC/PaaZ C-terminal domain-containing protein n=1 Tax=Streptomyces sp. C10-9-1 TaxID=1859285 RepID=UPI002112FF2D|nr:MaoC/PaaZ C-terminal domain-containing protein [Streptomyces sp. C10-9-1]MCQ6556530.1 MaoC/PaaZ C-terminal domain-containing protein [Streptomyces sp. C10-9-1]